MHAEVRAKIEFAPNDTPVVREVKKVLASDMHTRYQNREVIEVLNISSLLDPRFKTLAHLSEEVQEETFHCLKEAMMEQFDESPSTSMCSDNPAAAPDPPPPKKSKSNSLQQLLGNKFQDANSLGSSSTVATIDEIVSSEISRYKAEKPAGLDEKILLWWKARRDAYPNLSETARKYLGIVATSVPSERLFSIAGNTVNAKRAALDPSNVDKLVFLYSNLPSPHLDYKRVKCTCVDCMH